MCVNPAGTFITGGSTDRARPGAPSETGPPILMGRLRTGWRIAVRPFNLTAPSVPRPLSRLFKPEEFTMPSKKIDAVINGESDRVSVPVDSIVYNPYLANVCYDVYRLIVEGAVRLPLC